MYTCTCENATVKTKFQIRILEPQIKRVLFIISLIQSNLFIFILYVCFARMITYALCACSAHRRPEEGGKIPGTIATEDLSCHVGYGN